MREEFELELENRIRNLMWTVSGDYTLDVKPDLDSFRRSRYIALYDGIKQGAFARYFDREELSLYLVKKIYLQMCIRDRGRYGAWERCSMGQHSKERKNI